MEPVALDPGKGLRVRRRRGRADQGRDRDVGPLQRGCRSSLARTTGRGFVLDRNDELLQAINGKYVTAALARTGCGRDMTDAGRRERGGHPTTVAGGEKDRQNASHWNYERRIHDLLFAEPH